MTGARTIVPVLQWEAVVERTLAERNVHVSPFEKRADPGAAGSGLRHRPGPHHARALRRDETDRAPAVAGSRRAGRVRSGPALSGGAGVEARAGRSYGAAAARCIRASPVLCGGGAG